MSDEVGRPRSVGLLKLKGGGLYPKLVGLNRSLPNVIPPPVSLYVLVRVDGLLRSIPVR